MDNNRRIFARDPGKPAVATELIVRRMRRAALFQRLGPGLIAGAADDDPSGIATYSQAGAQLGVNMLWTMAFTYPMMAAIQMISARIGRVTGHGLAANMGRVFPRSVVTFLVALLFFANTINIGADLAAMGAAARLVLGWGQHVFTLGFAVVSLALQMFVPYHRYVHYLKWMTLALFTYVGVIFTVDIDWTGTQNGAAGGRLDERDNNSRRRNLWHDNQPLPVLLAGIGRGGGRRG